MCMGSKYILIIRNILSYNYPLYSSHQFYTLFPVSTIHIKLKYSVSSKRKQILHGANKYTPNRTI